MPRRAEAGHRGEQVTWRTRPTLPHLARRDAARAASSRTTRPRSTEGMVVLDAVHQIQADAGQRPGRALELQGRQVRLVLGRDQRHAEADVHDAAERRCRLDKPVTVEPMQAFPLDHGPGDRRVVELPRSRSRSSRSSRGSRTPPTAPGACSRRTSTACRSSASASSASCARTSATCCATTTSTRSSSARASSSTRRRWRCTRSTPRTASPS